MSVVSHFEEVIIVLAAAIFVVTVFKTLKLSPVLGYFVAGAIIGTHGLSIISPESEMEAFAEFGVVFLLFVIGLELTFERLIAMKKYVFGFGAMQIIFTCSAIASMFFLITHSFRVSLIIGCALSLSSTAIVMQILKEGGLQSTQVGRISISTLLLQDFMVVPLLILVPLLSSSADTTFIGKMIAVSVIKAIIALIAIIITGRLLLRPLFNVIVKFSSDEIFIATTLLIVLGAAYATDKMQLSMALGAFVAGIMVAETVYRNEVEKAVLPFKGLLLGVFFMTVGMSINILEIINNLPKITFYVSMIMVTKFSIVFLISQFFGCSVRVAVGTGLLLSQGSEFAFILFNLAKNQEIIDEHFAQMLMMSVTITMAITPLLTTLGKIIMNFSSDKKEKNLSWINENSDMNHHIIIAGFNKASAVMADIFLLEKVDFIILEINQSAVELGRSKGYPVYRGDVSSISSLKSAGIESAKVVAMSISNQITLKKAVKIIKKNFPKVKTVMCVPDVDNIKNYVDIGASVLIPKSYEIGLKMSEKVLVSIGFCEQTVDKIKDDLRAVNYGKKDQLLD